MANAMCCSVGDAIGHSWDGNRWLVESTMAIGVTVRRILEDGKLAGRAIPVYNYTLRGMVIFEHAGVPSALTVSSLDYMNDDELSDEDKDIIARALA